MELCTFVYCVCVVCTGPEKKTKIQDEETNICTAYHEAGHTLVAHYTKEATPLHKVTIIPRGVSLGHVSVSQASARSYIATNGVVYFVCYSQFSS